MKKIIIDETLNGGGDATTLIELLGFFMETVNVTIENKVSGSIKTLSYKVDTNYDGVYDEKDHPGTDYQVYDLISSASFSCGNLFALSMKEDGKATLIGQTTGGGSCIVFPSFTALGDCFQISGPRKYGLLDSDGMFFSDDDGSFPDKFLSMDSFYDIDALISTLPE